ncbi:MAG TPA: ABC transporter substrate-binding protein, partial [Solirubrobacteraceae bacterium]|nr:ABC transporter substrate-binding protein [Solirubrobacteraceae bacterium]
GSDRPNATATLVLDGVPDAVHVGVYVATARGYDEAEGVTLRVRAARSVADPARSLERGDAQLAVLDLHDLAIERAKGRDLVAVMSIAQLPERARARRTLRAHGRARLAARIDFARAPAYPELVLATTSTTLTEQRPVVRAAVRAIVRGYGAELDDPDTALQALLRHVPASRRRAVSARLPDVEEAFTGTTGKVGAFDRRRLRAWARWEARQGIVRRAPDVAAMVRPIAAPSSSY